MGRDLAEMATRGRWELILVRKRARMEKQPGGGLREVALTVPSLCSPGQAGSCLGSLGTAWSVWRRR